MAAQALSVRQAPKSASVSCSTHTQVYAHGRAWQLVASGRRRQKRVLVCHTTPPGLQAALEGARLRARSPERQYQSPRHRRSFLVRHPLPLLLLLHVGGDVRGGQGQAAAGGYARFRFL